jgi:hypothetical protein
MYFPGHRSFVLVFILASLGCGSATRELQSITITPNVADPATSPSGEVLFTATGNFNKPPMQEARLSVSWSVSDLTIASIDDNGLARCTSGATGTVTVTGTTTALGLPVSKSQFWRGTAILKCS